MSVQTEDAGAVVWFRLEVIRAIGLATLTSFIIAAYWSSFASMAQMWDLSSYRHGFIIPVICLFMLWRQAPAFVIEPWQGSLVGIVALTLCVWVWMIARATFVQALEHVAITFMLSAAVCAVAGMAAYRVVAFPFLFFAFALPIGSSVVPTLMQVTADASVFGLHVFGVPVFRQGMLLTLPEGVFEVAEVCSGFGYLNAGLALGVLVAHEMFISWPRRAVYVSIVAAAFVLTNGLRAFIVMAVASATDMRVLAGKDHVIFGWALFLLVMIALYFVAERFSDRRPKHAA